MKHNCDSVSNIRLCYIGGGSRGWAWSLFTDLALEADMCGEIRLYDIDRQAAEKNRIIGGKIMAQPDAASRWTLRVFDTLECALSGADIVVISILPGTFAEMRSDVHAPEAYGIVQSVGDTAGPGGFFRALRTVPMYSSIAQAVKQFAPDAWVISYTNPMALCVRTLYEVFPRIKAFGCCHEVFGTQRMLCRMLETEYGIAGVVREDLRTDVLGVNHFTWLTAASWRGTDLFPLYAQLAEKYRDTGYDDGSGMDWRHNPKQCENRVKFDLFRRFGWIAAAGDRHLAEFMPRWYLRDEKTANGWGVGLTSVDYRVAELQGRLQKQTALLDGREQPVLQRSGEEGTRLMRALLGLGDVISNVNLPNAGQISNLPRGSVVETNALFARDRISPVAGGALPGNVLAYTAPQVCIQESTLQAALNCDRTLAFSTFMCDAQMTLSPADGSRLFETMLGNTRAYLPKLWFA